MARPLSYDPSKPISERFWNKVSKGLEDSCWNWNGAKNSQGYGTMLIGLGKSVMAAHRISYMIHNGEVPDSVLVLHACDNRECVNPKHLFLGSYKDNTQDMIKKGRNKAKFVKTFNLSIREIEGIKSVYATGVFLEREIAERFGVTRTHVCQIIKGKVSLVGRPMDFIPCQRCGFKRWDGEHGHPFGGKRTPPKTLWCLGSKEVRSDRRFVRSK